MNHTAKELKFPLHRAFTQATQRGSSNIKILALIRMVATRRMQERTHTNKARRSE